MITTQEIDQLAALARIKIGEEEKAKLQQDLVKILDYVGELKMVNGESGEEKIVDENLNNLREDIETLPSLAKGEFVKVKKIL